MTGMASAFSSIKQGLSEAIDFAERKPVKAVVHEFGPLDVKKVRAQVGMSQNEFASAFGISVSTLRHWERGDRTPQGPRIEKLTPFSRNPTSICCLPQPRFDNRAPSKPPQPGRNCALLARNIAGFSLVTPHSRSFGKHLPCRTLLA